MFYTSTTLSVERWVCLPRCCARLDPITRSYLMPSGFSHTGAIRHLMSEAHKRSVAAQFATNTAPVGPRPMGALVPRAQGQDLRLRGAPAAAPLIKLDRPWASVFSCLNILVWHVPCALRCLAYCTSVPDPHGLSTTELVKLLGEDIPNQNFVMSLNGKVLFQPILFPHNTISTQPHFHPLLSQPLFTRRNSTIPYAWVLFPPSFFVYPLLQHLLPSFSRALPHYYIPSPGALRIREGRRH